MGSPERFLKIAADVIDRVSSEEALEQARQSYRRRKRTFVRVLKVLLWMMLAAIVIPITMITAGLLLGPRGTEGLIATPLAVLTTWALILYFGFRKPRSPRVVASADVTQLPRRTADWLEHERYSLPAPAQPRLDSIVSALHALDAQVRNLHPQAPGAAQLRRLLAEELPELVHGYQRIPAALQHQPQLGGASPAERLVDALGTIEEQIARAGRHLATDDLHALATQQRYLELKYKDGGGKAGG
ncbi:MAG TPA: hypothetical protein VGK73_08465 [Polyangiaceae bacterium]